MWRLIWQRWFPGVLLSLALCWLLGFSTVTLLSVCWPALDVLLWTQLAQLCWLLLAGILLQSRLRLRQLLGGAGLLLLLLGGLWLVGVILAPVSADLALLPSALSGE